MTVLNELVDKSTAVLSSHPIKLLGKLLCAFGQDAGGGVAVCGGVAVGGGVAGQMEELFVLLIKAFPGPLK
jgi:hypothetical protein